MKDLERIMQAAFVELKMRSEPEEENSNQLGKTLRNSSISASGETLRSVNLATVSRVKQEKNTKQDYFTGEEDDSMDSVESILVQSKIKNTSMKSSSLANTLRQTSKSDGLDATLQSQFVATIRKT